MLHRVYCSNKGQGLSTVSANKSQISGRNNGRSPIGWSPLWPDVCDLFRRYSTQTKSFITITKTGMILIQKRLFIQSRNVVV